MDNPAAHQCDGLTVRPLVPSDSWFRDLAEQSGDLFFVIRTQPDQAVEFMSDTVETHLGFRTAEMMADPELLSRCVDPRDADELSRVLASPPGIAELLELRWIHRDGRPRWSQAWLRSRERDDGSVVLEGTSQDDREMREVGKRR